jgi:hypothetical protein
MAEKRDPLNGLNPDQSGPLEKIQNGDPRSSPNRDQRSGAREAGGPGHSLQQAPTGDPHAVPPHDNLEKTAQNRTAPLPEGVSGETEKTGANDRSGVSPTISKDETLKDVVGQ